MSNDEQEAGPDPKAGQVLEFLRANPDKRYTVMDIYGYVYTEEEKNAHREAGGAGGVFRDIQQWLNEFRDQGFIRTKLISASIFYTAGD
jgi:hypothetical protein